MACEVADAFCVRLGMDDDTRAALADNFERWNGRGLPTGCASTAIPRPMRIAHVAQELEVVARLDTIDTALGMVRGGRGKAYDPEIADVMGAGARSWWREVQALDPWDSALALAPGGPPLAPAEVRDALLVLADFADLKSPWTAGHSRGVAELAGAAYGPEAEPAASGARSGPRCRGHRRSLDRRRRDVRLGHLDHDRPRRLSRRGRRIVFA